MKMWFFSKSLIVMLISLISSILLMNNTNIIFQLDINSSFLFIPFCMSVIVDYQSLVFISTVSAVTSMILVYSYFYFELESKFSSKKFFFILLTFVLSMIILSCSGNLFWMMIGWDGLGVSSFCLVIFYQNWKSFSSGMVTFMANRFGDTLIIISMVWIMTNNSSEFWMISKSAIMFMILSFGAFSKSAQMPYLFWLPQAMAAPTPVSALVHSSTLVTAGIYTICRFMYLIDEGVSLMLLIISSITVMVAGTSAMVEFDLKKVIAFSTLCHISMMMMFSVLMDTNASLFHFIMHAFFKSLLFMVAGHLIHQNMGFQDIRMISESKKNLSVSIPFFISSFSMMGFPLFSGFYSKELMLNKASLDTQSILLIFMFLVNSFFSCAYSCRMMMSIFSTPSKKLSSFKFNNGLLHILIPSSLFSIAMGTISATLLISEEEEIPSSIMKFMLLMISIMGMIMGVKMSLSFPSSILLVSSLSEMWKSNNLYKIFQSKFFISSFWSMWITDEKGMIKLIQMKTCYNFKLMSQKISFIFINQPFKIIKSIHSLVFSSILISLILL